MPLTDTAVRQAKPRDKDYTLNDTDGLSLFVKANGTKSWHFRFVWHGKQPRISLGTYPEITLRDARGLRDESRALVAKGIDPRTHRREQRMEAQANVANVFESVVERWYDFKCDRLASDSKRGAAFQLRLYLNKDILPVLGKLPIIEISRGDVLQVMKRIEQRKALNIARKTRTWLNEIFRFAIAEGLIETNPAADLDIVARLEPPAQHNPILRGDEIKEFMQKLRAATIKEYTRSAIRILLLTGVRTIELRKATIDQFDFDEMLWSVPADHVKQLRSRVRTESGGIPPYLVPLSRQAVEEVRKVHEATGRYRLILPGRHDQTQPISDGTINIAIKRMGYQGRLTGHGLRGTLSTALNEMGYNSDWIEAQLSHAGDNKIRGTYNHAQYVEQRRKMMQEWADYLDGLEDRVEPIS
jgi:integrase